MDFRKRGTNTSKTDSFLRIPADLHREISLIAKNENTFISEVTKQFLRFALEEYRKEKDNVL